MPWPGYGEPFNGQAERTAIILELVRAFAPDASIETGTFFGVTAAQIAVDPRVYTIERDPGLYNIARLRLRSKRNVIPAPGDSAIVLPQLAAAGLHQAAIHLSRRPLGRRAYHCDRGRHQPEDVGRTSSIVVDDFLAPHDSGYGYDIYDGQALCLERLSLGEEVSNGISVTSCSPGDENTAARCIWDVAVAPTLWPD